MPKNKGKGGKKHKKGKNKKGDIEFKRQLRAKAPGEEYARAIKALGSCRFNVIVYYEVKDDLLEDEEILNQSQILITSFLEELKVSSFREFKNQIGVNDLISELDGLNFSSEKTPPK